jgi:5-methylcytosine-specific restriction endonuclease McrA
MSEILNKNIVLVLNSIYQPIGYTSVKQAIVSLCSTSDGESMAAEALDLDYHLLEGGELDWASPFTYRSIPWDEWVTLPVRPEPYKDEPIKTSKMVIRAPIVIRSRNYSKMPRRSLRPNKKNLYELYDGRCIWTGKKLSLNQATVEHLKPRSHGGKETFGNLALAEKKINNDRGNIPLEEWTKKYKPHYKTKEPTIRLACDLISEPKRPEWIYFLIKKNKSGLV